MSKKTILLPEPTKPTTVLPKWVPPPAPKVDHLPMLDLATLPSTVLLQTLGKALTMRRDHESYTEAEFVGWLVNRLPVSMIDSAGNVHVNLCTEPNHRTMFTSHTDSVHSGGGVNRVRVDGDYWRADGAALGADDGAGIALMCHMIERGVPGYYVFFRGEECGGIGSSWLAETMPELLADFDRAVAFDRAGSSDVITHQGRGRCCSDKFAQALSDALNDQGQLYMPCDGGVYTDTAEFIHIIPECSNLSVGYKSQHGDREEQNIPFLIALADSLVKIDWDALPVDRDPKKREPKTYSYGKDFDAKWFTGGAKYDSGTDSYFDDDKWPPALETTSRPGHRPFDLDDNERYDLNLAEIELHDALQDASEGSVS